MPEEQRQTAHRAALDAMRFRLAQPRQCADEHRERRRQLAEAEAEAGAEEQRQRQRAYMRWRAEREAAVQRVEELGTAARDHADRVQGARASLRALQRLKLLSTVENGYGHGAAEHLQVLAVYSELMQLAGWQLAPIGCDDRPRTYWSWMGQALDRLGWDSMRR